MNQTIRVIHIISASSPYLLNVVCLFLASVANLPALLWTKRSKLTVLEVQLRSNVITSRKGLTRKIFAGER